MMTMEEKLAIRKAYEEAKAAEEELANSAKEARDRYVQDYATYDSKSKKWRILTPEEVEEGKLTRACIWDSGLDYDYGWR